MGCMPAWVVNAGWSTREEKESESMANSSSCLQSKQMDRWSRSNDTLQLVQKCRRNTEAGAMIK